MTNLNTLIHRLRSSREFRIVALFVLLVPYLLYIVFVVTNDQGPVDYETFMTIGNRFREGGQVYGENSYYPLPYVVIFSFFSSLPRSASLALWLALPVIVVLVVVGFQPLALLFAPVFSHFVGGQASVFGLLGFWGYRNHLDPSRGNGGIFLALTMLKPQLGVVPLAYAVCQWARFFYEKRKVPRQLVYFVASFALLYFPTFVIRPGWIAEWLNTPRPLFDRALSAAIPRLLIQVLPSNSPGYWFSWFFLSLITFGIVLYLGRKLHRPLDILLLWSYVVNPLVHDYDLIQVVPVIEGASMWVVGLILSIPGWWTIITSYANDAAWITFTIIAPGLLVYKMIQTRRVSIDGETA